MRFLGRAAGVNQANAFRLSRGNPQVSITHSSMKLNIFSVHPVTFVVAFMTTPGARDTFRHRQIEEQRQIGLESSGGQLDNFADQLLVKTASSALKGHC